MGSTIVVINKEKIVADKFDDEIIVVNLNTGAYYSLRGAAVDIWNLLESPTHLAEINRNFTEITEEAQAEIETYTAALLDDQLIVEAPANAETSKPEAKFNYNKIKFEKYKDMEELILLDPIHEVDAKGWPHENKSGE